MVLFGVNVTLTKLVYYIAYNAERILDRPFLGSRRNRDLTEGLTSWSICQQNN